MKDYRMIQQICSLRRQRAMREWMKKVDGEQERCRMCRDAQWRLRERVAFMRCSEDMKMVLSLLCKELHALGIGSRGCGINLVDLKGGTISTIHTVEPDSWKTFSKEIAESLVFKVWLEGWPDYRCDLEEEDRYGEREALRKGCGFAVRSVVDIPCEFGTLAVASEDAHAFSTSDIAVLMKLGTVLEEGFRRQSDLVNLERRDRELEAEAVQRRQMEAELMRTERLRTAGELAAGLSHNINNMLNGVIVPAQILKRLSDDADMSEQADLIMESGECIKSLARRLHLSIRGIEERELQAIDLESAVEQAVSIARPRWKDEMEARGKRIEVKMDLEKAVEIRAVKAHIHDIFVNLLFNAIDAMPGGGCLTIGSEVQCDRARVTIRDTGCGMDAQAHFRAFFQHERRFRNRNRAVHGIQHGDSDGGRYRRFQPARRGNDVYPFAADVVRGGQR